MTRNPDSAQEELDDMPLRAEGIAQRARSLADRLDGGGLRYALVGGCCITGSPLPTLLSASHIVAWSTDRAQHLNPRNGLCLAKTQDAAFDRHLITFDEDLRVVLSKSIRDHFTSEGVRANFQPTKASGLFCRTGSRPTPRS